MEKTRIKEEVNAIFFRDPSLSSATIGEKIKDRNTQIKLQIQNDIFLNRSFGKLVSEQLSKAKSYLKKKLFYDDDPNRQRYDAYLDEFTNVLFGGQSYLNKELISVAACLRYFRDTNEHYKKWREIKKQISDKQLPATTLTDHLKKFFDDFAQSYEKYKQGGNETISNIINSDMNTEFYNKN